MKSNFVIHLGVFISVMLVSSPSMAQTRVSMGWVEKVSILPAGFEIAAKLDTGAENSSLHAVNLHEFTRDGKTWVRFDTTDRSGSKKTMKLKVVDIARIKSASKKTKKRRVVALGICLGSTYMKVEVNLFNRSGFDYPMLIGRSFLAGNVTVDPARMFTVEPNCEKENIE